ncbi:hypothetical protein DITRI_Ditri15bG0050400 [Diplodiscus trichospermus]
MGKRKIISQLPHEIIVNILSRLPVKTLLRSNCVCKPWRSLISDPHFARLQLIQLQKNSNVNLHQVLLSSNPLVSMDYEAYNGGEDESKVMSELEYPAAMKKDSDYDVDLVGSCDGLVCLLLDDEEFISWNPSTRESRALPETTSVLDATFSYGLGYDFSTDDYKLVRVCCPINVSDQTKVEILSLKTNIWRATSHLPTGIEVNGNGIFLNGSLHWLAKKVISQTKIVIIVSFSLAEEKFQEVVAAPDHLEENNVAVLGISGDCLCLFFECNEGLYEGWLRKEYGVKSSWTRLFSNPVDPLPGYKILAECIVPHKNWESSDRT